MVYGAAAETVAQSMDEARCGVYQRVDHAAGDGAAALPLWDATAASAAGIGDEVMAAGGMVALCVDAGSLLNRDADSAAVWLATALALLHCWGVDAGADEAMRVRCLSTR